MLYMIETCSTSHLTGAFDLALDNLLNGSTFLAANSSSKRRPLSRRSAGRSILKKMSSAGASARAGVDAGGSHAASVTSCAAARESALLRQPQDRSASKEPNDDCHPTTTPSPTAAMPRAYVAGRFENYSCPVGERQSRDTAATLLAVWRLSLRCQALIGFLMLKHHSSA
jgi:hypothetical protein